MPDANYVRDAFARIADRYVLTNHVLSCGFDIWWRRVVSARVRSWQCKRLLDVASGTGDLALEIQNACPDCEVIATDFCAEMLEHASRRGVRQTKVADALALPYDDASFDAVTVAFGLRNMADYPAALREMRRVLRPDGRLLILDFSLPRGILRPPYRFYLHHILPRMAGWLTGQRDAYEYLGGSIEQFPSGNDMLQLLETCGYTHPTATPLTGGVVSIYDAVAGTCSPPVTGASGSGSCSPPVTGASGSVSYSPSVTGASGSVSYSPSVTGASGSVSCSQRKSQC